MNSIIIQNAFPTDAIGNPLPMSPTLGTPCLVTVNPAPLGTTGPLKIKISCSLNPDGAGQIRYRLTLLDLADWNFTGGNISVIEYNKHTSDNTEEDLDFELRNLNPLPATFPAQFLLEAMDPAPAHPNVDEIAITLSGN